MHVFVVGLNHRTAPLWLRERTAFVADSGAARHALERAALDEALVLSTCNRVEVYGAVPETELVAGADRVLAMLAERAEVPVESLRAHAYVHLADDAARHVCRVAAGFDSMVLGETQIVAQLKRALAEARRDEALGRVLQRLACTALAAGKRARAGLVSAGPTSMADAAIRALGGASAMAGAAVAIVGAGDTAADVLRCLHVVHPRRVVVVNRSPERAAALAARHGAQTAPWSELGAVVAEADVVFACTAAPEAVVGPAQLAHAEPRPRQIVDLGMPRNVDAAVRSVAGVHLLDVDALRVWSATSAAPAAGSRHADETEIRAWVERFARWVANQAVVPTITQLRDDAERMRQQELERALARLAHLGPREQEIVRALSVRLVNKLLHQPLAALSAEPDAPALADSARRLFGLATPPTPDAVLAPTIAPAAEPPAVCLVETA